MNRRNFLRQISLTATAAVVAPLVVYKTVTENSKSGLFYQMQESNVVYYNDLTLKKMEEMITELQKERK